MTETFRNDDALLESARELINTLGVKIVPLRPGKKGPILKDWPAKATSDIDQVQAWLNEFPGCNLGWVPGPKYLVVDVDPRNGGILSARRISKMLPKTRYHQTGGLTADQQPGQHHIYQLPDDCPPLKQGGKIEPGVDFKTGDGSLLVAPESRTDKTYRLQRGGQPVMITAELLAKVQGKPAGSRDTGDRPRDSYGEPISKGQRDSTLVEYAGELAKRTFRGSLAKGEALDLLRGRWTQQEQDDEDNISWAKVEERFHHFLAQDEETDRDPTKSVEAPVLADGYPAHHAGNVARWMEYARGRVRWVDPWKKWYVYRDGMWYADPNQVQVQDIAKEMLADMRQSCLAMAKDDREALWKWAKDTEQPKNMGHMLNLARSEPDVGMFRIDGWNNDPMLFNVRNGTIDLNNGELLPHKASDNLTAQAPVDFDPSAQCPTWLACVERWQPDPEVRWFLQKALGSGLSGHAVQHLFVNLGNGRNGKGVMFGTVQRVLGTDYYTVPHQSLLTVQKHGEHATVTASLYGARMAVASETAEGDRLNEASIKLLTGGDMLQARRMREDEWKFLPSHTMFLHTNHKPRIRGTDDGIWARMFLIPWSVMIPEEERDPLLLDKLQEEASGILNWLLAGCEGWQAEGFINAPEAVRVATDNYRGESDFVSRWIQDEGIVVRDHSGFELSSDVQQSFYEWCDAEGIKNPSWQQALHKLEQMGAVLKRRRIGGKQMAKVLDNVQLSPSTDGELPITGR